MRTRGITRVLSSAALQAAALALAAVYVMPMLYVLVTALQPDGHAIGDLWPHGFHWQNFTDAWRSAAVATTLVNSAVVTICSTAIQVGLACMAGYALARLPFRGRDAFFLLLIAMLVIPPEVTLVPLFVLADHVPLAGGNDLAGQGGTGLLNTFPGLMIPHLTSALSIFLMRQFYVSMPEALADAARIDGASEWTILWRIYTPLAWPAVVTVAVFAFQGAWNDFLWPLVATRTNDMQTAQLGLTVFFQANSTQWSLLCAAVILISIPVLVLFLVGQRRFQEGVMVGAVKQ
ncbi:MAG TPA: carbohydrate ABC transporter permease [Streptosporangiales bacterium]